ncbi:hypothetical protein [Halobellus ruber]|uniref:Small CPxCG-related zinc finger protein n=1 Tax=Halobellus ruber TaxID=2761102 RepID=A0A7J9SGM8_9EURY|nr:hypothetical protein [Halobellus ruber]MBB6645299.1 hypothetical protein [Halobellus ruber]
MDTVLPTGFECTACRFEHPTDAVRYDELGYPECPACGARTGPLAGREPDDSVEGAAN